MRNGRQARLDRQRRALVRRQQDAEKHRASGLVVKAEKAEAEVATLKQRVGMQ